MDHLMYKGMHWIGMFLYQMIAYMANFGLTV